MLPTVTVSDFIRFATYCRYSFPALLPGASAICLFLFRSFFTYNACTQKQMY
jgi:hypothetical protein